MVLAVLLLVILVCSSALLCQIVFLGVFAVINAADKEIDEAC
jgi:hypothetical protein